MSSDFHNDPVSHPEHYGENENGIECIEVTECMNFNVGNAVKYLWRAGKKGDGLEAHIQDLEKAAQYVQFEIERVERMNERKKKAEALKNGYLYIAPMGTEPGGQWSPLGYTTEGFAYEPTDEVEKPFDFSSVREAMISFNLTPATRANMEKAFNGHSSMGKVPPVAPTCENSCCSTGYYSKGKTHSDRCNVEKCKEVADKTYPNRSAG